MNTTLFNFRCPYCGDSQTKQTKARGYLYKNKRGLLSYTCHNCGESHSFNSFLKHVSPFNYNEYVLEKFRDGGEDKEEAAPEEHGESPNLGFKPNDWGLLPVGALSKLHSARRYLLNRQVPNLNSFFYTESFQTTIDRMGLDYRVPDDPRVILFDRDHFGNPTFMVARSVITRDPSLRYVELKIDPNHPKMFGLASIDKSKPVIVVEGAIDSLFLNNCIASLDANLTKYRSLGLELGSPTLVWDNEPRSYNTVAQMTKAIKEGEKVCIFPEDMLHKDINDMVKGGVDVASLIESRTFHGVQAMLEMNKWKRVAPRGRKNGKYYRH